MSGAGYSRDRIESVLLRTGFPDSYRIMPAKYGASPLGTTSADSRFCSCDSSYTVLHTAPEFDTAFIETVVRDRFCRQKEPEIESNEITERIWVRISAQPGTLLTLLDLRGDGCVRVGASTEAVRARNHAAGRALGRAIHEKHADVDGLIHNSRLNNKAVLAVFDRGMGKLGSVETGMLKDHPELPDMLCRCRIGPIQSFDPRVTAA